MDFLPTTRIGQSGMEFVSSEDGTKLGVRVAGGKGHRTPVFMLHGLQSHSGWFVQSQTFLANLGFPVFAMDRRGSGFSEGARGDCPDFREMIADVHAVVKLACERHDVEKVHIFGHCFGTIPAALFATAHSGLVASLVKASSGIHTKTTIALGQKLDVAWAKASRRTVHLPIPLKAEMFSDIEECVRFIREDEARLRTATGSLYFEVRRARRYISEHRHLLTMPIFMANAGNDPICNTAANERFFWSLPARHKLLVRYERARHVIEFSEHRDDFFRDLNWWLERFGDDPHVTRDES
jgi:alpha-beta hydrolase superfamily lysophospholipase